MASFDGATFREAPSSDGYPAWDARMLGVEKPRPAGNTPVWREVGMDVQRATIAIEVTNAQLVALYDKVLESGSLVMDWETTDALLESVGAVSRVGMDDLYLTTLAVIRL